MRHIWVVVSVVALAGCGALGSVRGDQHAMDRECAGAASDQHDLRKVCQLVKLDRIDDLLTYDRADVVDRAILTMTLPLQRGSAVARAYDDSATLEPDALEAALRAKPEIGDATRDLFVRKYSSWRTSLRLHVEKKDATWRAKYLQPALEARARWQRESTALSSWHGRAAALIETTAVARRDGAVTAGLAVELVTMRDAYVAACLPVRGSFERCIADDVARPLTLAVIDVGQAAGEQTLATAEVALLAFPDLSSSAYAEYVAASAALETERAHGVYMGEKPGGGMPDRGAWAELEVASVVRKGGDAVVSFRKDVQVYWEATGCHDTDKIDFIGRDGSVHYRVVCTGPDKRVVRDDTPKPVRVPWDEAAHLAPKDRVNLAVGGDQTARVVDVRRGDARVQVRGFRLAP